jgi:hypothetical protein
MLRHAVTATVLLTFAAGCSRTPERATAMSPTGPSAATSSMSITAVREGRTPMGVGGVSGPMDVLFPGRNDSFDFRNQLETKYQTGLNRAASPTSVDREGEVVWTQEYMRYRVNGCDHAAAMQRVFAQIDGTPPAAICAENPGGLVLFPPRNEAFAFRSDLEGKYNQMNRAASLSSVDPEGGVIWTQEYLRYRTNACDHPTSVQKVFSQIDGNGVAPTCFVPPAPCAYRLTPGTREVGSAAGTNSLELFAIPGGCTWTATSSASWLTLTSPATSDQPGFVNYAFSANQGSPRSAEIRFDWSGGSTTHRVDQGGSAFSLSVEMFDPFRQASATTNCQIRSAGAPNTCNLVASTNLPAAVTTYAWTATYIYGAVTRTVTQSSASNTLAITDQCGLAGSTAEGASSDLLVSVTATDAQGNSQSLSIGSGQLRMTFFTCGV